MASSDPRPLRTLLLSLLLFLAMDTALFRSGLYARIQSPESTPGKFFFAVLYENRRSSDPTRDVLVLGNSKMVWGFSPSQHERAHPHDPLRYIHAASSAAQPKWWYYQLRAIDPRRDRYRAIIIPVNGYLVRPDADALELGTEYSSAQAIAPLLSASDWLAFLDSFTTEESRRKALRIALFAGHGYDVDVADMVLRPLRRIRLLKERERIGEHWLHDSTSRGDENVSELHFDFRTGRVSRWPAHFNGNKRFEAQTYLSPPSDPRGATARGLAYSQRWLNAVIDSYRASATQLIIVPVPAYAMPTAGTQPIAGAPDIRNYLHHGNNVTFLGEDRFKPLARPELFYDILHMNTRGRSLFTEETTAQVSAVLAVHVSPNPTRSK